MRRLLCRLGWHKWEYYEAEFTFATIAHHECAKCHIGISRRVEP